MSDAFRHQVGPVCMMAGLFSACLVLCTYSRSVIPKIMNNLSKLWQARELLYMLMWRDISIKYKQSVMGLLWAVLMPALIVAAGALVRIGAAQLSGTTVSSADISSVMVRAVTWAFMVSSVRFGTSSLTGNNNLVSKIAFPKETFPIAAVMAAGVDYLVSLLALIIALIFIGWTPTLHALWALPLLALTLCLCAGIAIYLSAANLFYRDVKYLVEIFLTYAIFFTPVLYEAEILGKWAKYVMLNPFSPILEALDAVVVKHQNPDPYWTAYSVGLSIVILVLGYLSFKRFESTFAERI
jgi:ABC-type polysaccharide/polyol phosphate export permease